MEKEQAYADAAVNYEAAWKLTNCSNPAMGNAVHTFFYYNNKLLSTNF
jgi:hypothetical protein